MANIDCTKSIPLSEWLGLKHGDLLFDYDGKGWEVVYIDRGSSINKVDIARVGARQEVSVRLQNGQVRPVSEWVGGYGVSLTRKTGRTSGAHYPTVCV